MGEYETETNKDEGLKSCAIKNMIKKCSTQNFSADIVNDSNRHTALECYIKDSKEDEDIRKEWKDSLDVMCKKYAEVDLHNKQLKNWKQIQMIKRSNSNRNIMRKTTIEK